MNLRVSMRNNNVIPLQIDHLKIPKELTVFVNQHGDVVAS